MTLPTKVTREALEAKIKEVTYVVMPDGRTTICQITMANGFTVRGESSCVSKENFNAELGREYSYDNAVDRAWAFEGYLLAEQHHHQGQPQVNENDNNTQDQAEATPQSTPVNDKTSQIQSVDEFGDLLFTWHNRQVATVRHFLEVPENTEVQVGDKDQITLTGDVFKGYKLGLELGLHYLGTLPFGYTPDVTEAQEATDAKAEEVVEDTPANSVH